MDQELNKWLRKNFNLKKKINNEIDLLQLLFKLLRPEISITRKRTNLLIQYSREVRTTQLDPNDFQISENKHTQIDTIKIHLRQKDIVIIRNSGNDRELINKTVFSKYLYIELCAQAKKKWHDYDTEKPTKSFYLQGNILRGCC